eukprot:2430193-Prymnesium_polylepis.1
MPAASAPASTEAPPAPGPAPAGILQQRATQQEKKRRRKEASASKAKQPAAVPLQPAYPRDASQLPADAPPLAPAGARMGLAPLDAYASPYDPGGRLPSPPPHPDDSALGGRGDRQRLPRLDP